MALQLKFFVLPVMDIEAAEVEINRFLKTVRVINIQREFVAQGDNSFWSLCVEYLVNGDGGPDKSSGTARKSKIDYKAVLNPKDFSVFARLREWRKRIAIEEAVPVYTIFSNEQLASMVEKRTSTKSGLREIEGIGEARISKYGDAVLKIVAELYSEVTNETGGEAVRTDSNS